MSDHDYGSGVLSSAFPSGITMEKSWVCGRLSKSMDAPKEGSEHKEMRQMIKQTFTCTLPSTPLLRRRFQHNT